MTTAPARRRQRSTVAASAQRNGHPTFAELLDQVTAYLTRYLRLPSENDYGVLALWVAHTYVMQAWRITPYLAFSATYGHGKTIALDVLESLVRSPWRGTLVTAPVLFRLITERAPTMLLDELDATWNGDPEAAQAIRAVLNTGDRPGGTVPRIARTEQGRDGNGSQHEVVDYKTFCAKALAGVGTYPTSLVTRSIVIDMPWVSRHDLTEYRRFDAEPVAAVLRASLTKWATEETSDALSQVGWTVVPDEIEESRTAQLWTPLVAIADLAGGPWPDRVRAAILERHSGDAETRETGQPDKLIDAAIRDALDRGFVRMSGPKDRKQTPPNIGAMSDPVSWGWGVMAGGGFKDVAVWCNEKERTVELRMTKDKNKDDWHRFYTKVRAAASPEQRTALPATPDDALRVLKQAGRLHTDGKGLTSKVAVYTASPRSYAVRINISHWCWPHGQDVAATDSWTQEEMP